MSAKIKIIYEFLQSLWPPGITRRGKPYHYDGPSMLLFFVVMFLKRIHSFQAMSRYAQEHYRCFGWSSPPCRKTLVRRFEAFPTLLYRLLPLVAQAASKLDQQVFGFRWAFIDKSVFRAKGGLWHRTQRRLGIVPHPSIDPEASWAKSAYHGWRFGYGLHLVCNGHRFPLACSVTTAATKEATQVVPLLVSLVQQLGMLVADAGYQTGRLLQQLLRCWNVWVLLPSRWKGKQLTAEQQEYNRLRQTPQAHWLYQQRKPSIEPAFALIKELFQLAGESQLPYRGIAKVKPYLMITASAVQLMMYYNFIHHARLASTYLFLTDFK
ncbi:MAG: transposase [Bacteroidota bacterium]|nr:transposase [Bacteroidota bacterium]